MKEFKFEDAVNNFVHKIAGDGFTPEIVIQNTIIRRMAELQADFDVWSDSVIDLPEFSSDESGPITGEALYNILVQEFTQQMSVEKARILRETEKLYPRRLSDEEREFLKSYTEEETANERLVDEAYEAGAVPEFCKSSKAVIAMFWRAVKEDRMSRELFTEQLKLFCETGHTQIAQ